ncbi:ribonucleoside triphosphate reductase [Rubneribacter badeniensis]|uniref:ribonucleoside triphosphate reductase n=1 Tax=Rubneribacter badeniensis TaxID=2070688 RepID=UPI0007A7E0EB|nr:ribonucleoside triphosphate reductase [Gordonibacter sp. An232A]OUO96658.1 ribonucleoside triphosphate reductase [Gordonibacter sp. An232A]CVH80142.1 Anaerobic ribonucleoside-triphosphate reductase [Coriobacteriaceae bacterium CHKCI002]
MYEVQKRDGQVAEFDIAKISSAIAKAFEALEKQYHPSTIDLLALNVTAHFEPKIKNGVIAVEDIQDSVEEVLSTAGYADVAKSYILYRRQREKVRNANATLLDYKDLVDQYVKVEDWRVKENSTVTYSVGGLILSNSGAITANYWLSEIYDDEVANAHRNADIHLHDLSMLTGYCAGWSLKQLIQEGLGGVPGKITSKPASHLSSLCNQMVNFLGIMQNEWAGAQAFSSFDTYLAPFVKVDNLTYEETKQCVESFVFGVNTPSRWGTQAPFSNITLDWVCPADLRDQPAIVGGREMDFTYGDCKREMDMVNKAFIEIMIEGDANGRGFQYPIPTYSITSDFDWSETENNRLLFEMTSKYGTPYFSNYINSDMEPSDVRSMCCRLRLDLRELRKKSGGFFGSGESTGSVGVVTINMPRLAYLASDEVDFYRRLDHLMDVAARSLKTKREVITRLLNAGLYPYTKRYLGTFENHFSTIGLVGMNEACLNAGWLRVDLTHEPAQAFTKDVLNHMRDRLSDYQEKYGDLYNLEATPAESTTYRFAKHDKEQFPDIVTANDQGKPYYTNSSHLPVGFTDDIFSALDVQDELQTLYTSGTVFHAFLGEKLPDWKAAATLVRKIAENYKLPYYTLSPTYSVCKNHGYIAGEVYECPCCHEETEVYSRITGYYRPVKNWNDGKSQEFADRVEYDLAHSHLTRSGVRTAAAAEQAGQAGSHVTLDAALGGKAAARADGGEAVVVSDDVAAALGEAAPVAPVAASAPDRSVLPAGVYLVATRTCPNCKHAAAQMNAAGIAYEELLAEENVELAQRYRIMQAPTLLEVGADGAVQITSGAAAAFQRISEMRAQVVA